MSKKLFFSAAPPFAVFNALESMERQLAKVKAGVLQLDKNDKNAGSDYTLKRGEKVWLTVKERFSISVHETDEGVVVDIFARGHEDEGSIGSAYAFDNETICDCPDHPWNTEQ